MVTDLFESGYCEMSAKLFRLSAEKGYSSVDFVNKLLSSQIGQQLYNHEHTELWLGHGYIMESLEAEVQIEKGEAFPIEVLEWMGWIYRVWTATYMEDSAKDMLRIAPPEIMNAVYEGFHCMDEKLVIEDLKALDAQSFSHV